MQEVLASSLAALPTGRTATSNRALSYKSMCALISNKLISLSVFPVTSLTQYCRDFIMFKIHFLHI